MHYKYVDAILMSMSFLQLGIGHFFYYNIGNRSALLSKLLSNNSRFVSVLKQRFFSQ